MKPGLTVGRRVLSALATTRWLMHERVSRGTLVRIILATKDTASHWLTLVSEKRVDFLSFPIVFPTGFDAMGIGATVAYKVASYVNDQARSAHTTFLLIHYHHERKTSFRVQRLEEAPTDV